MGLLLMNILYICYNQLTQTAMTFISQHSDDGNIKINLAAITAYRLSKDNVYAEVLLSDGKWIRISVPMTKFETMLK